jgi:hypothetical protein
MRVVFYAVPTDLNAKPKSVPDEESECAQWVTTGEFQLSSVCKFAAEG